VVVDSHSGLLESLSFSPHSDSAYSERYLGVPDKRNLYSYEDSNLLDNVVLLRNKNFLLVFGTSDGLSLNSM